jgi:hypothetical protein
VGCNSYEVKCYRYKVQCFGMVTSWPQGKNKVDDSDLVTRSELLDCNNIATRFTCFWMFPKVR